MIRNSCDSEAHGCNLTTVVRFQIVSLATLIVVDIENRELAPSEETKWLECETDHSPEIGSGRSGLKNIPVSS
jgi:hypothetical protein